MSNRRSGFNPTTRALDQISVSIGRKRLPETIEETLQAMRDAQQYFGERASHGDESGMAEWLDFLEKECAALGATGLAQKLEHLRLRAQQQALTDPFGELDEVMAELDAFLEALGSRRERTGG